jgi:hypothetical protein
VNVAPSDANGQGRYEELADRVRQGLAYPGGAQSIESVQIELSLGASAVSAAGERLGATKNVLTDALADIENADSQAVAASILSLQTRLEATYVTTASLSQLSLAQYLG